MSVNFSVIESKALQLGGNSYEQGKINIPAETTVTAGTILARGAGEKVFKVAKKEVPAGNGNPAVPADTPCAVMPFDIENKTSATANFGFRAITGGKLRKDMLNFDGDPVNTALADSLRDHCGITVVDATDVSRVNPEL